MFSGGGIAETYFKKAGLDIVVAKNLLSIWRFKSMLKDWLRILGIRFQCWLMISELECRNKKEYDGV